MQGGNKLALAATCYAKKTSLLFDSENIQAQLDWLNTHPKPEHKKAIRVALKKSEFKFPKDRYKNSAHPLEFEKY